MIFLYISWNVDPALYDGYITLRYYSLFLLFHFYWDLVLLKNVYPRNAPIEWMDKLLMYSVIGTILGQG